MFNFSQFSVQCLGAVRTQDGRPDRCIKECFSLLINAKGRRRLEGYIRRIAGAVNILIRIICYGTKHIILYTLFLLGLDLHSEQVCLISQRRQSPHEALGLAQHSNPCVSFAGLPGPHACPLGKHRFTQPPQLVMCVKKKHPH